MLNKSSRNTDQPEILSDQSVGSMYTFPNKNNKRLKTKTTDNKNTTAFYYKKELFTVHDVHKVISIITYAKRAC